MKTVDAPPTEQEMSSMLDDCGGILSVVGTGGGEVVIHGHNTPWGMGISAFSDKINVWDQFPQGRWLLILGESEVTDDQFLLAIKKHKEQRRRRYKE